MVKFYSEKISPTVTRIHGLMDEQMYLVEGMEKAALIDTGSGAGSLKKYVETLTDKPVIVLLTHGHLDHAMGAPEFDNIYMNHEDNAIYRQHCGIEIRKEFLSESPRFAEVREEDYLPAVSCDSFSDLREGDIFELGGITIEIFACPGHTPGSVVMLLREERSLLTGDACNCFTFLYGSYSTDLTAYEKSLRALKQKTDGKYDRIYLSHGESDTGKELVDEVLAVCVDIKNGRSARIPYSYMREQGLIAKAVDSDLRRTDGKMGNIVYDPERI